MSQLGVLVVINIAFGFASGGSIDNAAHLGGLAAGLWLGVLVRPSRVPTPASLWQWPGRAGTAADPTTAPAYVLGLGLAAVAIVVVAGIAIGTGDRLATGGFPADDPPVAIYSFPNTTWGPGSPVAPPAGSSVIIAATLEPRSTPNGATNGPSPSWLNVPSGWTPRPSAFHSW